MTIEATFQWLASALPQESHMPIRTNRTHSSAWDHQSRSSSALGVLVWNVQMDTLCLNMVFIIDNPWWAQNSNHRTPHWFWMAGGPNHVLTGLTLIGPMSVESPQDTLKSPVEAHTNTPCKWSKKCRWAELFVHKQQSTTDPCLWPPPSSHYPHSLGPSHWW